MADLTLDLLKKAGAFTGAPVKKEIIWNQGETENRADVYVRRLSYHSTVAELLAFSSRVDAVAARISACICDEKGEPVFTPGDITGDSDPERGPLDGEITISLLKVIAEVNGLGETPPEPTN